MTKSDARTDRSRGDSRLVHATHAVADVAVGGTQIAATVIGAPLLRRRYNRWGATPAEVDGPMLGDHLVQEPKLGYTRAITIDASLERVWPWLAQIGKGRGGLYSFDGLENVVGGDIHSVHRIVAEQQDLSVGDLIRLGPEGYPCFRVRLVNPPTELILIGADPKPPHEVAEPHSPGGLATWQWVLRPTEDGLRTRLLVRQRLTYPNSQNALWHVVEPVAFVMERQMMLGIKRRAESPALSASA
jgi:hypothetical protein